MTTFDLKPGSTWSRRDIHERFGGTPQGGISPSNSSAVVMLFSANDTSLGLRDGWGSDGCFHFAGQGLTGDQQMKQGNRALLEHKEAGRAVHLFQRESAGLHRYIGEFEVDADEPWYNSDGLDAEGTMRNMFVFRLRPVGATADGASVLPSTPSRQHELRFAEAEPLSVHDSDRERSALRMRTTNRPQLQLLASYRRHLEDRGHEVGRMEIRPAGERVRLVTDLFDVTDNRLVECKGSVSRDTIRNAIGMLLDYRRFISPTPMLVILVPSRPRDDLIDLCSSLTIEVIWPGPEGDFVSSFH